MKKHILNVTMGVAGIALVGGVPFAKADSESPNFISSSGILSLPIVSVDSITWYSDVDLQLNFDTGQFSLLSATSTDGAVSLESRIATLEDLVVPSMTVDEETALDSRVDALEVQIVSPISEEAASLDERISALESVLNPAIITTNLQPGRYLDNGDWCFDLSGPYVYDTSRVTYFIQSCSDYNTPVVMEFVSGSTDGHPQMGERLVDLSMPDNRIYGLITDSDVNGNSPTYGWQVNEIVGVRQSGDFLTVDLYSAGATDAQSTAYATITLTKQAE